MKKKHKNPRVRLTTITINIIASIKLWILLEILDPTLHPAPKILAISALTLPMIVVLPTQHLNAMNAWDGILGITGKISYINKLFTFLVKNWYFKKKICIIIFIVCFD